VDIGDLFGDLFGGGATRGARPGAQGFRSARRGPRPGPDVEAEISVTLRDVAEGAKKNLRIAPPGDEPRTVNVTIPAGVEDGMRLRLAGQGGKGEQHAANGDLYVIVRVASDPNLTRHGRDLECEVPVPFATAALGGKVRVPTLKGQADLTVPAGTQGGQVLRLRGMGLPRFKETARGDQLVRVRITVPTTLTEEQRQAIEKLR
jgi:curved DNA-binding protein